MKPFTFERMEQTLQNYRQFKQTVKGVQGVTQQELDELMRKGQAEDKIEKPHQSLTELPKGFNRATWDKVLNYLQQCKAGASADEVAAGIGVARVTARRYLDFMEKCKLIKVDIQYGSVGRPINQYYV